eukprot:XP_014034638.1 PREDICTED: zinc finger protein 226-like [Salmo salar]
MASWDLDVVLAALAKPPFEPLESASLKHLSMKVAFVVAITSMKRVGELHALSVSSECYRMDPGGRRISLRPNSSFLPKVLSDRHVNIPFILSAYDPPGVEESGPPSGMLCPARALAAYVERTRALRTTDHLCLLWPVLGSVVAQSTRGVAVSWALLRGVPLADIVAAASWASSCTFARYYWRRLKSYVENVCRGHGFYIWGRAPATTKVYTDKASPSPSTLQESPGPPPHRTLLLVLVDCRKPPGQSGTERREEEHGDMISLRDIPNHCFLSGKGLSSGEPQQHDADKKEKSLSRSEHLKKHQHRAIGKKLHCCSDCWKKFAKQDLTIHEQIHTGEKPYSCDQCGKSFVRDSNLIAHQRIHTGAKPYSCDQCGKSFYQLVELTRHQRIHTGEKPYSCDQCGKRFALDFTLTTHQRIHTGEKPYSCLCGKSFAHSGSLKKHQDAQMCRFLSPSSAPVSDL